jgi:hypothetical protein
MAEVGLDRFQAFTLNSRNKRLSPEIEQGECHSQQRFWIFDAHQEYAT